MSTQTYEHRILLLSMNDKFCGLFLNGKLFVPYHHCCRLVKTVENAAAVALRCLLISAQFVNISQVSIRIPTTVKNAEYAGKEQYMIKCYFLVIFPVNVVIR